MPSHQHRADPRPRGHADARPHLERRRLPRPARVPVGRRAPAHPLEVDGEDRRLHGPPVRADPPQPPRRGPEPREERLPQRGRVRARGERGRQPRRPRDPRRPHGVGRRLLAHARLREAPHLRGPAARHPPPGAPARRPRRRRSLGVGARHPRCRPGRRGRRRGHLGRVPGLRLARRRSRAAAPPRPRSRSTSRWSRWSATPKRFPGCARSPASAC